MIPLLSFQALPFPSSISLIDFFLFLLVLNLLSIAWCFLQTGKWPIFLSGSNLTCLYNNGVGGGGDEEEHSAFQQLFHIGVIYFAFPKDFCRILTV
ncbi:hypothetical protein BDD12DRAFT_848654 [Trichophaea hybrida]|nr:hypothetical protein BDD12DRAFT_848654 [Trichophaea hybrida]